MISNNKKIIVIYAKKKAQVKEDLFIHAILQEIMLFPLFSNQK